MSMPTQARPLTADTSPATAARLHQVTKRYGSGENAVTALDGIDLAIGRGQLTAVMGPSGSGKSTCMHIAAGLDRADSGNVLIGDEDITTLGDEELTRLRRRRIGFIFQAFNLVPTTDVRGNIALPFELDDRTPTADEKAFIDELVGRLGLRGRLTHRPGELSGGQQQRVAIARALATRPELVFADEPTGNLDLRTGTEVLKLLSQSVREFGQTIMLVTHDAYAASFADRIVFLVDGRVATEVEHASRDEISALMSSLEGIAA